MADQSRDSGHTKVVARPDTDATRTVWQRWDDGAMVEPTECESAFGCVSHNEQRAPKALIAMRGPGGQVRVVALANEYQEAH